MAIQTQIAGKQIDGARDYQEDAFLITHLSDTDGHSSALIIVADGMGGHAAGNVASNMAVQAFNKHISSNYPAADVSETLNEAISKANSSLTETIKETAALHGMGCTMVSAIIEEDKLWWVSVGDSHLYLLRNRNLIKLNEDHSYGGFIDRMEAAGTPISPEKGLARNMLMSALTGDDIAEVDCPLSPFLLQHDDRLVICSDGMDTLSQGKITQYTLWADTPKECTEGLLDAVEEVGSPRQDNTTAVVVLVVDEKIANSAVAKAEEDETDGDDDTIPGGEEKQTVTITASHQAQFAVDDRPSKGKFIRIIAIAASLVALIAGGYIIYNHPAFKQMLATTPLTASKIVPKKDNLEVVDEEPDIITTDKKTAKAPKIVETPKTAKQETKSTDSPEPAQKSITSPPVVKPQVSDKKEFQDDLSIGGKTPTMIIIPAGSFEMGSPPSSSFAEERPRHTVDISSFAVSKYEITYAEYNAFAKTAGKKPAKGTPANDAAHYPVVNIKWDDAISYTKWLSKQSGKKYRLLSESEWEYAASTGAKTLFWWGNKIKSGLAHCFDCDSGLNLRSPAKIGSFVANKFGLHDTSGNVAEWVRDCWHKNYENAPSDNDVWEGGECRYRVIRGGSYGSPVQSIRNTKRDKLTSNRSYDHVGFRIARELN